MRCCGYIAALVTSRSILFRSGSSPLLFSLPTAFNLSSTPSDYSCHGNCSVGNCVPCFHGKEGFSLWLPNALFHERAEEVPVSLRRDQLPGLAPAHWSPLCDSRGASCSLSLLGFHARFLILDLHILLLSCEMILSVARDHLPLN